MDNERIKKIYGQHLTNSQCYDVWEYERQGKTIKEIKEIING